jgi:hypothetical protein
MSAADLRHWAAGATKTLNAAGVTATPGAAPHLAHRGSTWVSIASSRGCGRLIRDDDGSSRSSAHRYSDGASLVDTRAPTTTRDQLDALVRCLASNPRPC